MQPHYQRVIDELAELDEKRLRLIGFIGTPIFANLDEKEQGLLKRQLAIMSAYSNLLAERIEGFNP